MAVHLYWRLTFDKGPASTVDLREVGFFDAAGVDVSVGGVAAASSEYGGAYLIANLFDKSTSTLYATASSVTYPQWVQYRFASPVDVYRVRCYPNSGYYPTNPRLSFSDDGVAWSALVPLVEFSGGLVSALDTMLGISAPFSGVALGTSKSAWAFRSLPGPLKLAVDPRHRAVADTEFGGFGRIWGTTKTKSSPANLPTKARVVLLHQRSKLPVREVWSDPITGDFAFEGIDTRQEFLTLAEDAAGNFRPVAASRLVPEVTP